MPRAARCGSRAAPPPVSTARDDIDEATAEWLDDAEHALFDALRSPAKLDRAAEMYDLDASDLRRWVDADRQAGPARARGASARVTGPADETEARRGLPGDEMPGRSVAKGAPGQAMTARAGATARIWRTTRAPTVASTRARRVNAAKTGRDRSSRRIDGGAGPLDRRCAAWQWRRRASRPATGGDPPWRM